MKVVEKITEIKDILKDVRSAEQSIGFVPTMGALHEGHISLIRQSANDNDSTVCSIFVNPIQFNNPEDLKKYPRDLSYDLSLLSKEKCDLVFAPGVAEIYPDEIREKYDFGYLETIMEGKYRPGHFHGVAVVVKRLLDIIQPDRAYFGEKDYQQLMIIKTLVKNLDLPVEIIPCPIVREPDGLAMSSRNIRLSKKGRELAPAIHRILQQAAGMKEIHDVSKIKALVEREFEKHPYCTLEYFEIADPETLLPLSHLESGKKAMAFVAVFIEGIRLIDNIVLFS